MTIIICCHESDSHSIIHPPTLGIIGIRNLIDILIHIIFGIVIDRFILGGIITIVGTGGIHGRIIVTITEMIIGMHQKNPMTDLILEKDGRTVVSETTTQSVKKILGIER